MKTSQIFVPVMRKPQVELQLELIEALEKGLVLVPHAKLEREIRLAYNEHLQNTGQDAWTQANVFVFDTWIRTVYEECQRFGSPNARRAVCNPGLFRMLAEKLAPRKELDLHIDRFVEAWQMAWQWNLWPVKRDFAHTENGRLFLRWSDELQSILHDRNEVSHPELIHVIESALLNGSYVLKHEKVVLYKFAFPTRMQSRVMDYLVNNSGAQVIQPHAETSFEQVTVRKYSDAEDELRAAAIWCRTKLSEHGERARIGLVYRGDHERSVIQRQFESVFPEIHDISRLVDFGSASPMLRSALWQEVDLLLRWTVSELAIADIRRLERSDHFGKLDWPKKGFNRNYPERFDFGYFAGGKNRPLAKNVLKTLGISRKPSAGSVRRDINDWITSLGIALKQCGWETASPESSLYIEQKAIGQLLARLPTYRSFLGDLSWREFIDVVRKEASTSELPDRVHRRPIEVLNGSEVVGTTFDAIWITHLSNTHWPAATQPNPLIPIRVQREARVFRSSPKDETLFSDKLLSYWMATSNEVNVSYAKEDQDDDCQLTPLIDEIHDDSTLHETPFLLHPWDHVDCATELDTYANDVALPLTPEQKKSLGSKHRSLVDCPLKARLEHMSNLANSEDDPVTFGDASARGKVIHSVMESALAKYPGTASLKNGGPTDNELTEWAEKAVNKSMKFAPELYKKNEIDRSAKFAREAIDSLLAGPFFEVAGLELKMKFEMAGFPFNIYIDRVDKLNGGIRVVDIKTGKDEPTNWDIARSRDTTRHYDSQMPLYAIAAKQCRTGGQVEISGQERAKDALKNPLRALVYQRMIFKTSGNKPGETVTDIKGIQEEATKAQPAFFKQRLNSDASIDYMQHLNGIVDEWEADFVDKLKQYESGNIPAHPVKEVCEYCDFQSVCRVFERAAID